MEVWIKNNCYSRDGCCSKKYYSWFFFFHKQLFQTDIKSNLKHNLSQRANFVWNVCVIGVFCFVFLLEAASAIMLRYPNTVGILPLPTAQHSNTAAALSSQQGKVKRHTSWGCSGNMGKVTLNASRKNSQVSSPSCRMLILHPPLYLLFLPYLAVPELS